ncbi:hypothetical protein [Streptomyces sp. A012304]|uniref:hypothetical protein n=1 Tax=Streptomyces sp. A012304 TaxID=375446 RepID=UPI002230EB27|nr:hypothetical protein [Streptomyces sp. A012304]GKQ41717.1 hypothetical protein ALMP_82300 [Streptomyces sp. A012304]
MTDLPPADWWSSLPGDVRDQVDGHVLRDARLPAVQAVLEAGRARGLGLDGAQFVVHERYLHHGDRVARRPGPVLDVESLAVRAAGLTGRVVAIEAVWDGDTVHDWFVDLVAVTAEPAGEHRLTTIPWGAAVRRLGDEDPGARHPSAVVADRIGGALAARLSVPFRFTSPDIPGN